MKLYLRFLFIVTLVSFFGFHPSSLSGQNNRQTECDFSNNDFLARLSIGYRSETRVYEDCTIIPITADIFYPDDQTGSLEVCVIIQGSTAGRTDISQATSYFRVNDAANFNLVATLPRGELQYCQTIAYPDSEASPDDISFQRLFMYVVPMRDVDQISPEIVLNSRMTVTEVATGNSCTTGSLSIGFEPVGLYDQQTGVGETVTDGTLNGGVNLSNIMDNQSSFFWPTQAEALSRVSNLLLAGNLNIDIDYDLGSTQNNSLERNQLVLYPDATINILPGVNANLTKLDIRGCETMWNGIIVHPGATLTANDLTVQDGEYAFQVMDDGSLTIAESNFDNNHIGIFVEHDGTNRKDLEINSIGNHFGYNYRSDPTARIEYGDPEPSLLPPYEEENPEAAAYIHGVNSGVVFMNSPNRGANIVELHQNGVVVDESAITVSGTKFRNLYSELSKEFAGIGVLSRPILSGSFVRNSIKVYQNDLLEPESQVTFDNMRIAIATYNDTRMFINDILATDIDKGLQAFGDNFVRLRDSDITARQYGVHHIASRTALRDNTILSGNTIKVLGDPDFAGETAGIYYFNANGRFAGGVDHRIRLNDIILDGCDYGMNIIFSGNVKIKDNHVTWDSDQFGTYGISVEGTANSEIESNLIEGFVGPAFTQATAIQIIGGDNNRVSCNTVDKLETGTLFFGNNNETDFKGNNYFECGTGLQIGVNLPSDPTFIGPQIHRGNEWIGPFTSAEEAILYGADSDPGIADFSKFEVFTGINSNFLPTTNLGSGITWFANTPTGSSNTFSCSNPIPTNPPISPIAEEIFAGTYNPNNQWTAAKWTAQLKVTKAIAAGRLSSSDYPNRNAWMQTGGFALASAYAYAEEDIFDIYELSNAEITWLETTDNQAQADEIIYADNTISKYMDGNNYTPTMEQSRQQALTRIKQAGTDNQAVYTTLGQRMLDNAPSIASSISNLPVYNTAQQYQKTLDSITFVVMLNPAENWGNYMPEVATIASACPLKGGRAVYQARGLANVLGMQISIDSMQNCAPLPEPKSLDKIPNTNKAFNVYPNPSNGDFTISYPSGLSKLNFMVAN